MAMDKAYIDFHRERTLEIFHNFSAKDIYEIDYDYLIFDKEKQQYQCYGYWIAKFNKVFYFVSNNYRCVETNYKATFDSVEELNGFLKALYKIYHKQIDLQ